MRRVVLSTIGLLAAGLVAGCGSGANIAPVSGVVKLNGKPYPGAMVSFQPIGGAGNPNPGKGSMGLTDQDGKFTLYYDGSEKGAVVGTHRVRISTLPGKGVKAADTPPPETGTPDDAPGDPTTEFDPIPLEWHEKSDKTFDVPPGGTDQANFDIVGAKNPRKGK
jgi:hypothetical protein